jgi:hypothetical protein
MTTTATMTAMRAIMATMAIMTVITTTMTMATMTTTITVTAERSTQGRATPRFNASGNHRWARLFSASPPCAAR